MARGGLDTAPGGRNEALDCRGVQATCELLLLGFETLDDGDGEELFVYSAVEAEDVPDLGLGVGFGEVSGVALLPEEFTGAQERFCKTEDGESKRYRRQPEIRCR